MWLLFVVIMWELSVLPVGNVHRCMDSGGGWVSPAVKKRRCIAGQSWDPCDCRPNRPNSSSRQQPWCYVTCNACMTEEWSGRILRVRCSPREKGSGFRFRFGSWATLEWGVGSVVVGFGVFGAPRFSVQRSQNTGFKRVLGPLDGKSGSPKNAKFNHDGSNPPSLGPSKYLLFYLSESSRWLFSLRAQLPFKLSNNLPQRLPSFFLLLLSDFGLELVIFDRNWPRINLNSTPNIFWGKKSLGIFSLVGESQNFPQAVKAPLS